MAIRSVSARHGSTIPQSVSMLNEQVLRLWLSGRRQEAAKLRRRLITLIRRELKQDATNVRLWCLLGDTFSRSAQRMACYRRALGIDPNDGESNAELARICAQKRNRLFSRHFDRAIKNSRKSDVEESVVYAAMDAATIAGDSAREKRARRLGARRFPDSTLFRK